MDKDLLALLVCPLSKTALEWKPESQELFCKASVLAYPVKEGIPVMLEEQARALTKEELEALS